MISFTKISDSQYYITFNKVNIGFGHLIQDSKGEWVLFIDKKNVALTFNELKIISEKISELNK